MITVLGQDVDVKVKELNEHHMSLVALFDKLHRAIISNKSHEQIGEILDQLIRYAEVHFAAEEKYFKQFNYADAESHILEHQKFRDKINELKSSFTDNELKAAINLVQYLEQWFFSHVAGSDKKYSATFNENGLH